VVVGDVRTDEVLRLVHARFGGIEPGPEPPRLRVIEPPQLGERRVRIEREGTTAYLKLAYDAPAAHEPDFHAMLVLDALLTGAKGVNLWSSFRNPPQRSSRLYRALVDRRLASSVFGALLPTEHPFLYTIAVTATDGVPLEVVEEAALREIEVVRRDGISRAELDKARRQLHARLVFESDSVTNIAHQLGYFATIGDVGLFYGMADAIARVSVDDVGGSRRSGCTRRSARSGGSSPPPPPTWNRSGSGRRAHEHRDAAGPRSPPAGARQRRRRRGPGDRHPPSSLRVGQLPAGSAYDPPDAVGVAHFVSRVIDRGTESRTADVISEALDGRGVALNVGVSRHLLTVSCMCLAEDLEAMLDVIADIVRRPTFPRQEVETRRGEIVTAIRQDEDSPASMAVESLFGLLYPGGHPYGRPVKGELAGIEGMAATGWSSSTRRTRIPMAR
jgi:zinc protease